jgi:hypothetical protein
MGAGVALTMFTKQVSDGGRSGSPVVAAEAQQVERTRRKTLSRGPIRGFLCPTGQFRWTSRPSPHGCRGSQLGSADGSPRRRQPRHRRRLDVDELGARPAFEDLVCPGVHLFRAPGERLLLLLGVVRVCDCPVIPKLLQ